MGTGASSRRGSAAPKYAALAEALAEEGAAEARDHAGNVRPCDRCGETRRTARFGGEEAQWLCAACQLAGGGQAPRGIRDSSAAPRPRLTRGFTVADMSYVSEASNVESEAPPGRRSVHAVSSSEPQGEGSASALRRSRRGGKEKILSVSASSRGGASLRRSQTASLELKLSPRSNYRSHQGLMELKEQIGLSPPREEDSPAPKIALAPVPKRRLAANFCHGDAVQSLVSRLRRGSRVLELGHEGTAVGASRAGGPGGSEEGARLLVQFRPGFDWYLALPQVCSASSYASARSAGLPGGFSWGTRVQSLVTYLSPPGAKKEIWLGDSGTVVGPGLVKGKLAVRFDDARGEWSIWPSTICQAEDYDTAVAERLPGSFCRGDRVRALGSCRGSRNTGGPSKGSLTIEKGEEGTVVGPGHACGHLLVHFDSDERVWSMVPTQVVLANSGYTSVV